MAELKPCPFCGGEARLTHEGFIFSEACSWYVFCERCGARIEICATKKVAKDTWNGRAENEELKFTRKFIHEHGLEFALASAWNRRVDNG